MNNRVKRFLASVLFVIVFLALQKAGFLKQADLYGQSTSTLSPQKYPEFLANSKESEDVVNQEELYTLIRAVDGDTLVVLDNQKQEKKVRLIGVNTPETVDPRRPVECFGKEASNFTKELVPKSSKQARLEFDDTQQKYDKYGRLLAYVYLVQNTENAEVNNENKNVKEVSREIFLNQELIKQGYAYEYTYKLPYKFQSEFKKLEQEAKQEGRGLWGSGCK